MADSGYPIGIISIHALHEESDKSLNQHPRKFITFQSTLSMRRATQLETIIRETKEFQSTLSMRRATVICDMICG